MHISSPSYERVSEAIGRTALSDMGEREMSGWGSKDAYPDFCFLPE